MKDKAAIISDPFYRIVDSEITVPGVKGTHTLMQISDIHLAVWDEYSDAAERETAESREANWMTLREDFTRWHSEPFDDSKRIPSLKVLEKMLALAEETEPEVLLMTGDVLDFVGPAGVRAVKKAIGGYRGRLLITDGNHDVGSGICPRDGVGTAELEGFTVVAVDNGGLSVSDAALAQLKALCAEGAPLIVAQHVPVLTDASREKIAGFGEYFYMDAASDNPNTAEFVRVERDEEAVRAVLCGHLHCFVKTEAAEGKPMLCASSALAGFVHRITIKG